MHADEPGSAGNGPDAGHGDAAAHHPRGHRLQEHADLRQLCPPPHRSRTLSSSPQVRTHYHLHKTW